MCKKKYSKCNGQVYSPEWRLMQSVVTKWGGRNFFLCREVLVLMDCNLLPDGRGSNMCYYVCFDALELIVVDTVDTILLFHCVIFEGTI